MILGSDRNSIAGGRCYAGTNTGEDAILSLEHGGLMVTLSGDGKVVAVDRKGTASISSRVGRIPRRITFEDGTVFETDDNDAVDRLLHDSGRGHLQWVHRLERFHPRLVVLVATFLLLAVTIYRYALPLLVEVAVAVTPPALPGLMGAGIMKTLDQTVFSESVLPEENQADLREKFEGVAKYSELGRKAFSLNFRAGGVIGPNAFALPDGTIIITDELIGLAGGDDEMILGVLAHEIGHVEKQHSLRQVYRMAGTAGLVMLIAGDIGQVGEDVLTNGAALLSLSYSRSAESEADRVSVGLMARAGHDPAAIGRFFEILEKELHDDGETSIFATHPGTPERKRAIETYLTELNNN